MSRLLALTVALLLVGCTHAGQKKVANSGDSDSSSESASTESDKDSDKNSDSESKSPKSKSSGDESDVGYAKGKKLPPGPACQDQQGNVQECMSDGDCCKNFYCGFDPDGSARQKVCLFGG